MRVRVVEYREWAGDWVDTWTVDFPDATGSYNIHIGETLCQSDRIPSIPYSDPNAWAYLVGISFDITVSINVDLSRNTITGSIANFHNWGGWRRQTSPIGGRRCIIGNYGWNSSLNGAELLHYIGPAYSGQGDAWWGANGGSVVFDIGGVAPQTRSGMLQFASFYNYVNGNRAFGYICIENTLPPDYRPGERKIDGTWWSHDRWNGVCERNAWWYDMRTIGGGHGGRDNPPEIKTGGTWWNQNKLGNL